MSQETIRIRYIKSEIGYPQDQRQTLRSLGLNRLNQTVEKPNTPDVRGMVYKVRHLVEIEGHDELTGSEIQEFSG